MLQEIMRVDVDDRAKPESTFTIKKKNTTLHIHLVIFPHNTGFLYLSTTKNLKKKKLCNLYLLSKLGT